MSIYHARHADKDLILIASANGFNSWDAFFLGIGFLEILNDVGITNFLKKLTNNEMNLFRKKITLRYFLPLCLILALGCSEDEKPNCPIDKTNGDPKSVLGTWQLVTINYLDMETGKETIKDFSCDNLVFTFLENGDFVVKGTSPDIPFFGDFTYEFKYGEKLTDFGNSSMKLSLTIHPSLIEKDKLTLNSRYVDGAIYVFYRISMAVD